MGSEAAGGGRARPLHLNPPSGGDARSGDCGAARQARLQQASSLSSGSLLCPAPHRQRFTHSLATRRHAPLLRRAPGLCPPPGGLRLRERAGRPRGRPVVSSRVGSGRAGGRQRLTQARSHRSPTLAQTLAYPALAAMRRRLKGCWESVTLPNWCVWALGAAAAHRRSLRHRSSLLGARPARPPPPTPLPPASCLPTLQQALSDEDLQACFEAANGASCPPSCKAVTDQV